MTGSSNNCTQAQEKFLAHGFVGQHTENSISGGEVVGI